MTAVFILYPEIRKKEEINGLQLLVIKYYYDEQKHVKFHKY